MIQLLFDLFTFANANYQEKPYTPIYYIHNDIEKNDMPALIGHISQVIGPVVDVSFDKESTTGPLHLPRIHEALKVTRADGRHLTLEVQQHIGEDTVRTVAMDRTDGLSRGMKVFPTGSPITMPTGTQIKGRMMNVTGDSIDGMSELDRTNAYPIHREPPKFEELKTDDDLPF